ncbi:MAG: GNAT family N-acetyltransferase/peptidase C39 family protein [Pseudomonadales bacterium]|nr:GNAT family N-acetyltransferase/peptidase C39 family protein [Pseudomonadales bacterium]
MTTTIIRRAKADDLMALLRIEMACFQTDRLSKRSFRHWLKSDKDLLFVAETQSDTQTPQLVGYCLVLCNRGTRLARLYSLAVLNEARGLGIARNLLLTAETHSAEAGRIFLRLEVSKQNAPAIKLYESLGYRIFGEYSDYYDDHSDALRMQKKIQNFASSLTQRSTPWYQQTTEFTCGPASLIMAMASQDEQIPLDQGLELDIWREATTIFMTSGHGGCHPIGLANAAKRRGFEASVFLNTELPLFLDGVRSETKKTIMSLVHDQFLSRAKDLDTTIVYDEISQRQVSDWLQHGYSVLILISTYRLDGKKAPHWVTVTGIDERCLYVHDPDLDEHQVPLDCQHLPIAKEDFDRMSAFGTGRLRTALAIRRTIVPPI